MRARTNLPFHQPVLLNEVADGLQIQLNAWYIDATAGGGGHTQEILKRRGCVFALDQDQSAIDELKRKFSQEIISGRLIVERDNFKNIKAVLKKHKIVTILGVLFDLGMSTFQIKQSGRGFSFQNDERLDMRMDDRQELTAAIIINQWSEADLTEIFMRFGEEKFSRDIAREIVDTRKKVQIQFSGQLAQIAVGVYAKHRRFEAIHPATRIFQAIRIGVNQELKALKIGLIDSIDLLQSGGKCAVISFHSLEDRIVKQTFLRFAGEKKITILTKKPLRAGEEETEKNPAARSAKLRIIEKK